MRRHPIGLIDYLWNEFNLVPAFERLQWRNNVAYGSIAYAAPS